MMRSVLPVLFLLSALGHAASAQAPGHNMPGMAGQPAPAGAANQQEMMRSMERMNRDMTGAPMSGNPDRDFTAMMIPHHQGAIDMARIYLREGKDPAMRRMARKIIEDQEREIQQMKAWQARHQ